MAEVIVTADAQTEFEALPVSMQRRVREIFSRLGNWPAVSGAKPLRGNLHGSYRIRTGDFRIVFKPSANGQIVTIWKIGNRGSVYD
jgi:mRNA-degrading endonuclease RelE of RelBE toxin-antitoxin system